jgi:hypothetical protein
MAPPVARQNHVPKPIIDLALKWMKGDLSTSEAQKRFGNKSVNATIYRMGIALRQAYRQGLLK